MPFSAFTPPNVEPGVEPGPRGEAPHAAVGLVEGALEDDADAQDRGDARQLPRHGEGEPGALQQAGPGDQRQRLVGPDEDAPRAGADGNRAPALDAGVPGVHIGAVESHVHIPLFQPKALRDGCSRDQDILSARQSPP